MRSIVAPSLARESALLDSYELVVGVDEVGRGAIAGPLLVGAVALGGRGLAPARLRDSKDLSAAVRDDLVHEVRAWARASATGAASVEEIEERGLRWALALATDRALTRLAIDLTAAHVLMDGPLDLLAPPGPGPALRHVAVARTPIVRADQLCASVAAASVVAKVQRDAVMRALGGEFPPYLWDRNKGYGTPAHYAAIAAHGPTHWHRLSWLGGRVAVT